MILDEVLQESTYDTDSMVDMFVEGFLYALEMQENGQKAGSIEELSDMLSEAASEAISESIESFAKKAKEYMDRAAEHEKRAKDAHNDEKHKKNMDYTTKRADANYEYHKNAAYINKKIGERIASRIRKKALTGTYFPERKW